MHLQVFERSIVSDSCFVALDAALTHLLSKSLVNAGWLGGRVPGEGSLTLEMDVSKNGGTQQPWVFLLKMIILGCFGGTPIFRNTQIQNISSLFEHESMGLEDDSFPFGASERPNFSGGDFSCKIQGV